MARQGGKIGSTAIIWSLATVMMAISIPLVNLTLFEFKIQNTKLNIKPNLIF